MKYYDAHFPLMDQNASAAYGQVAAQVLELRDGYQRAEESAKFQQKLAAFRERYVRRPGMLRRIAEA